MVQTIGNTDKPTPGPIIRPGWVHCVERWHDVGFHCLFFNVCDLVDNAASPVDPLDPLWLIQADDVDLSAVCQIDL